MTGWQKWFIVTEVNNQGADWNCRFQILGAHVEGDQAPVSCHNPKSKTGACNMTACPLRVVNVHELSFHQYMPFEYYAEKSEWILFAKKKEAQK